MAEFSNYFDHAYPWNFCSSKANGINILSIMQFYLHLSRLGVRLQRMLLFSGASDQLLCSAKSICFHRLYMFFFLFPMKTFSQFIKWPKLFLLRLRFSYFQSTHEVLIIFVTSLWQMRHLVLVDCLIFEGK